MFGVPIAAYEESSSLQLEKSGVFTGRDWMSRQAVYRGYGEWPWLCCDSYVGCLYFVCLLVDKFVVRYRVSDDHGCAPMGRVVWVMNMVYLVGRDLEYSFAGEVRF